MTCIVAVNSSPGFVVAADSRGMDPDTFAYQQCDSKIFAYDGVRTKLIIAVAGSYRMMQVVRKFLDLGSEPKSIIEVSNAVRKLLKNYGMSRERDGVDVMPNGSSMIVVDGDKAFVMLEDYSTFSVEKYAAIGSGAQFALGAMHATFHANPALDVAKAGITAAIDHDASVGYPIQIMCAEISK